MSPPRRRIAGRAGRRAVHRGPSTVVRCRAALRATRRMHRRRWKLLVLAGTNKIFKFSHRDIRRIEARGGKRAETMDEEEITAHMDLLGITRAKLDEWELAEMDYIVARGDALREVPTGLLYCSGCGRPLNRVSSFYAHCGNSS